MIFIKFKPRSNLDSFQIIEYPDRIQIGRARSMTIWIRSGFFSIWARSGLFAIWALSGFDLESIWILSGLIC